MNSKMTNDQCPTCKWMTVLKWLRWAGLPLLPNTLNFPMWHPCSKEKVHALCKPQSDLRSLVLISQNEKKHGAPAFLISRWFHSRTCATSISTHLMLLQFSLISCWNACDCSVGAHHGGNQPCGRGCSTKAWHQNGENKITEEKVQPAQPCKTAMKIIVKHHDSGYLSWKKELRMFGWKGIPQKSKQSKSEKSKSIQYFSTFRLFFFPLTFSTCRVFGFSSSLSTLNGSSFVLFAAHVQLERHPAKIQTVKKWKPKSILFDFSSALSPFRLVGFSAFLLPSRSQRFNFCTFSCACSAGKASGKNSKSKSESQKVYFSTFRN